MYNEYVTAAKGVKPTDVIIDPTNLDTEQQLQLAKLVQAANSKPLTPLEVLQNEVKNLEKRIIDLEQRIQTLEYYKSFDNKIRRDWIEYPLNPRFVEPSTIPPSVQQPFTLLNSVSYDD